MRISQESVVTRTVFIGSGSEPDSELGECMKLIRKLRWIGLEDEADRLQQSLTRVAPHERGAILDDPLTTD